LTAFRSSASLISEGIVAVISWPVDHGPFTVPSLIMSYQNWRYWVYWNDN